MKTIQFIIAFACALTLMSCNIDTLPLDTTDSEASPDDQPALQAGVLYWSAPLTRTNGHEMISSEIGGYEIRYKDASNSDYEVIVVTDANVEQYNFDDLENLDNYTFEVAVFDTDGIYSDFVAAVSD